MMFIKDGHPLALEIKGILDDNMDKTDKAEVSTTVGDFKIMDKTDVVLVSANVGVKGIMSKLKFKINFSGCKGHLLACKMPSPVALEDILGWMFLNGEDITNISCFLVGLVTGDNWQNDHGDNSHKKMTRDNWQNNHGNNSHKKMTRDNWQNDHGNNSQCRETGLSCNRCSRRLGPKANLLIYEVVQGKHHEVSLDWPKGLETRVFQAYRGSVSDSQECLLLQENIVRNKQERTKNFKQQAGTGIWRCDMPRKVQKQHYKKVTKNKRNTNWQGSRCNDVEAVNQVFGANEVEFKQKSLEALRLLRQADQAYTRFANSLLIAQSMCEPKGELILEKA